MRKLILVAVILQLAITLTNQYKFGDIIAFKRKVPKTGAVYKHYAVYVGNNPDIGQGKHDIFERTGPVLGLIPPKLSDCIFEDLSKEEANKNNLEVTLENYFDGVPGFRVGTVEEITARINEKHHKCGTYSLLCNNCEHVATYIRYEKSISLQADQFIEKTCKMFKGACDKVKTKVKEIRDGAKHYYDYLTSLMPKNPGKK